MRKVIKSIYVKDLTLLECKKCLLMKATTTSALPHFGLNRQRQNKKQATHKKTSPQQESVARLTSLGIQ